MSDSLLSVVSVVLSVLFFFKQKTAYEMRISDWSSDVCSSDLLDADRARSDHQQLRRHLRRHHRMAIGPDPLPVRLGEGQVARPGTRRDDDVLRFEIDRLVALLDGELALGGDPALTRDHRDLVLLHQAGHARVELPRHLAAALHDLAQIERRLLHRQPIGLGMRAIMINLRRSEEHTSELQSLMRISYAVFCLKKKNI